MEAKHTPGPWEARWRFGRQTTVSGRQRFPICDTGTAPISQANHLREEANARLIAAAPELFEVVAELLQHSISHYGNPTDETYGVGLVHAKARAAIAKAERQS